MRLRSSKLVYVLLVMAAVHFASVACEAVQKKQSGHGLEPVIVLGDGESREIEFTEKRARIYIPVTIPPGRTGWFFIDTGISRSPVLRSDLAAAMGLEKYKDRKAMNIGKKFDTESWRVKEVRMGGGRYDDFFVQTYKGYDETLSNESRATGLDVIGILSVKFLEAFLTRIDYDSGLVSFDSVPAENPCTTSCGDAGDTFCIPFSYTQSERNILVEVRFNDLPTPVAIALNTGAPYTSVSKEILDRLGEERSGQIGFSGETRKREVGAVGGGKKFREEWVRMKSFSVGDARLEPFRLNMMAGTTLSEQRLNGLLGMNFLRNFNVTLDLKHKCLILEKNANYHRYGSRR
ncbi:aspartyl protease family protein [Thermodesulfobacteriota bacterium]